jgi:PhnB protein
VIQPYLFFDGRCEEALEFYRKALDAEVTALIRFKDSPDPTMCQPGIDPTKVMHANFQVGETQVMAFDGRCEGKTTFQGFALSLNVPTEAEADRLFKALAEGGEVQTGRSSRPRSSSPASGSGSARRCRRRLNGLSAAPIRCRGKRKLRFARSSKRRISVQS